MEKEKEKDKEKEKEKRGRNSTPHKQGISGIPVLRHTMTPCKAVPVLLVGTLCRFSLLFLI